MKTPKPVKKRKVKPLILTSRSKADIDYEKSMEEVDKKRNASAKGGKGSGHLTTGED
jgi:hypothetical protein